MDGSDDSNKYNNGRLPAKRNPVKGNPAMTTIHARFAHNQDTVILPFLNNIVTPLIANAGGKVGVKVDGEWVILQMVSEC